MGFGVSLDPNAASIDSLRLAIEQILSLPDDAAQALAELGESLRATPGRTRAFTAVSSFAPQASAG